MLNKLSPQNENKMVFLYTLYCWKCRISLKNIMCCEEWVTIKVYQLLLVSTTNSY